MKFMKTNRIASASLTILLLALLCRCIYIGLDDFRIYLMLVVGVIFGSTYAALGRLPNWMTDYSGGNITHDDDPSNLSPKLYLSILFCLIIVVLALFFIVLRVL